MPRCKHCKEKFETKKFNWKYCEKEECTDVGVKELVEKQKKKKSDDWKKEKRVMKEKLKTREDYYQEALKAFNAYIRERDRLLPCISCGAIAGTYRITSGHFHPQGTYRNIALDEDNAHGQCWFNCNKNKHGNLSEYRPQLEKKIGKKRLEELDARRNETRKFSIPELIELRVIYKDKLKSMKKKQ